MTARGEDLDGEVVLDRPEPWSSCGWAGAKLRGCFHCGRTSCHARTSLSGDGNSIFDLGIHGRLGIFSVEMSRCDLDY
jgi:hypothetical protein